MDERRLRTPAVAGQFYPAAPAVLARGVDLLVEAVPVPDGEPFAPAYVVPHAGYRYSGPTAAHAYARLRPHADGIRRVVLIGPAHRVPVVGCVVPGTAGWLTPLGEVPIDTAAVAALAGDGYARVDDRPLAPEHSLEVQLPFLQRLSALAGVPPVPVLPIAVGASTPDEVAGALSAAVATTGPGTIILCSTDLSHYRSEVEARAQDSATVRAVEELAAARIGRYDACGAYALRGLLGYALGVGLRPALLHRATSADAGGDRSRVVGYASFALRP
ncbi:AmmeMemoRadiSam system protein B [Rugosimonospora acidiphila]|uniref:MEMO1 family protein GCM10023322_01000 n=1 Tax=Rugosimonospora acidiphila TaxID=556531 RepID=A0ABP9RGL8_9ACTN